jgi:DnaJ family protein C protein 3
MKKYLQIEMSPFSRITHLSSPSTNALMRVFRLSYFFLPSSPDSLSQSSALTILKQCLHFDPDSKVCLSARRVVKKLDKSFSELENLISREDWRGVINLVVGIGKTKDKAFARQFDEAMESNTLREHLVLPDSSAQIPLPNPEKFSPRRKDIYSSVCRAYTHLGDARNGEKWCVNLLGMDGAENDENGLVGKAEGLLLKEEWEEAVRVFEKAFDASGKSNRDVRRSSNVLLLMMLTPHRSTNGYRRHKGS